MYGVHICCALVILDSSGSPGVSPAPGLTPGTQVVCVCIRTYTCTHPPTRKNREICKTISVSLLLPKRSLPRQQQALPMDKLKNPPLPIHSHTRMQVFENTFDTQACSRETGQYK